MKYEIKSIDAGGRIGLLKHNQKEMITPNLFPVFSPFSNLIPPREIISEFGGDTIFTNAYILYNNDDMRKKALEMGLHEYMEFNGLIATDSGAFQYYMYGNKEDIKAAEIERFQEEIEADFPVILDKPVQITDDYKTASDKVDASTLRAKENINRRTLETCAWFGPVHGSQYPELVRRSANAMGKLDFGIYAIGGVVKTFNDYMFDISLEAILTAKKYLPANRPIHLFGAGLPQFFALSVACGADTMDSAAYILFAKKGRYMTLDGTKHIEDLHELPCTCPICSAYSAREIQEYHCSKQKPERNKGIELIARHNLYVSFGELKTVREAIRGGVLWDLVEKRIRAHPKLLKAYQLISEHGPYFESMEPSERNEAPFYMGNNSFNRPIFYRTSKRLLNNYGLKKNSIIYLIPEIDATLYNSPSLREWTRCITKKIIKARSDDEKPTELLFVSNLFGLIPLPLVDVYPFSQREWFLQYERNSTESEHIRAILMEKCADNQANEPKSDRVQELVNIKSFPVHVDSERCLNRIKFLEEFFELNQENIERLIVFRPSKYISSDNRERQLFQHLIDDLILILQRGRLNFQGKYKIIEDFNKL